MRMDLLIITSRGKILIDHAAGLRAAMKMMQRISDMMRRIKTQDGVACRNTGKF